MCIKIISKCPCLNHYVVLYPDLILTDKMLFKGMNLKEIEGLCKKSGPIVELCALQHLDVELKRETKQWSLRKQSHNRGETKRRGKSKCCKGKGMISYVKCN